MAKKIIIKEDELYECPVCGYRWERDWDLLFDKGECCLCCPICKELIEDGEDGGEYV